ncbi:zinc finger protein 12-like [Sitodiplosis mosellana]|uniref:zinc finger protein 12-like n=1 Tax=Sitodiplosis mosellana TaxID=263140 RepID=UPI0024447A39|nr:zinc finger protein 12-like [Sitodiplosis mosellana]
MNNKKDMDPLQLCRICAIDVANEQQTASHPLIENNQITELGAKFISCLGIQLMKEGYPDRVCDYCQLQLHTFHAFVRKAKMTSNRFESMLQELRKQNSEEDNELNDDAVQISDMLSTADMDFDMQQDEMNEIHENSEANESIEVEFLVDKAKVELADVRDIAMPVNGDDDEYTVEYLESEYIEDTFDDEMVENEEEDDEEQADDSEGKSIRNQTKKGAIKRTYPYKCPKCNKRFVYKEVYDAHIRIHKGLPGFVCPHCPKTFNEKSNFDYHMQDHTGIRPAKCHLCEKSFKNKQDLASHIRCHKDIRKYMCDVCGKRFRSQSHMTYHRYAHFEARNFACDQCAQRFKSPHILRTHKNTVHSTVFRYECETCGRKFKRDHHLVAHRRTHNKPPGKRSSRKKKAEKNPAAATFQMVEVKQEEEFDISYEDDTYEEEFITD